MQAETSAKIKGFVYRIVCHQNGRYYVGSSTNPDRRIYLHRRDLNAGKHHSPKLQAAWNKYGSGAFSFEIIEQVEGLKPLLQAEQRHIDAAGKNALNCAPVAGSPLGVLRTAEQRAAMSEAKRAFYQTQAGKAAIEARRVKITGRIQPPEERAMRSAALAGKKCGRVWTPEQRAAHSLALKGRKMPPMKPETKAKISMVKRQKNQERRGASK